MAEPLYFVRARGRITGPYSVDQLETLHARGQFGRFHEVSLDQVSWAPADSIPGLFSGPTPPLPHAPGGARDAGLDPDAAFRLATVITPAPDSDPHQAPAPEPAPRRPQEWYYLDHNDQETGPVSVQELQELLDRGQVKESTFVCTPEMTEWVPLSSLAGIYLRPTGDAQGNGAGRPRGKPAASSWKIVLVVAAVSSGVLDLVAVSLLGVLSVVRFQEGDQEAGAKFAFVAFVVFILIGVVTVLFAAAAWMQGRSNDPVASQGRRG
jgi:hypothetical protein